MGGRAAIIKSAKRAHVYTMIAAAVVVIAVIALAWWLYARHKKSASPKYTASTCGSLWTNEQAGLMTCAGSPTSQYCIVPEIQLESACNSNPACIGYIVPDATSPWTQSVAAQYGLTTTFGQTYTKPLTSQDGNPAGPAGMCYARS